MKTFCTHLAALAAALLTTTAAQAQLKKIQARAREAIEDERDLSMIRLKLSLEHQGLSALKVEQYLLSELAHYDQVLKALDGVTVTLDSVCAYVVTREVLRRNAHRPECLVLFFHE